MLYSNNGVRHNNDVKELFYKKAIGALLISIVVHTFKIMTNNQAKLKQPTLKFKFKL